MLRSLTESMRHLSYGLAPKEKERGDHEKRSIETQAGGNEFHTAQQTLNRKVVALRTCIFRPSPLSSPSKAGPKAVSNEQRRKSVRTTWASALQSDHSETKTKKEMQKATGAPFEAALRPSLSYVPFGRWAQTHRQRAEEDKRE